MSKNDVTGLRSKSTSLIGLRLAARLMEFESKELRASADRLKRRLESDGRRPHIKSPRPGTRNKKAV